jgi:tRNA dimethylallyltransferase
VYEASGRALTDWQAGTTPVLAREAWRGVVVNPDRDELYRRIETRLEAMVADGAMAEVETLMARGLDPALPAMKALGVASFADALASRLSPAEALAHAKAESRRYAKRQITWFNRQAADWPRIAGGADEAMRTLTREG